MVEDGNKKAARSNIFIDLNRDNCFYNLVCYCSQLVLIVLQHQSNSDHEVMYNLFFSNKCWIYISWMHLAV